MTWHACHTVDHLLCKHHFMRVYPYVEAVFGLFNILWFFAKATFLQINYAATFTSKVCLIKKVFLLKALWKVEQVLSCLQHRLIDLVKHGWHFPLLNLFTFKIFCYKKPYYHRLCLKGFGFFWMPKLEVQQKFLSILVQFVKYANFCQIIFLRSDRILRYTQQWAANVQYWCFNFI